MKVATYIRWTAVALCALGLFGCSSSKQPEQAKGTTLTVYESLPRQGVSARTADAVAAGARLALSDARGRAGGRRIRLVELDSSKPGGEMWDPAAVESNAKRAADDPTTIAYLGEVDGGASAISLPVTNDKGILQVSPGDGLTGLTRIQPGEPVASGPERFYPSGKRTFLRLVPTDNAQAATLVGWIASRGAHRLAIVQDDRLLGRELATQARIAAGKSGLTVARSEEASRDSDAEGYQALAERLEAAHPDAVLYTGAGDAHAGPLLGAIAHALPGAPLYTGSSVATAEPAPQGLPVVSTLKPALAPSAYGPRARRILARLRRQRGAPVGAEALYGYASMRLVLGAVAAAGTHSGDRVAVARAALAPREVTSVLGDFRVTGGGDVSVTRFGSYRRRGESFVFEGPRRPPAARP
jgi:branched-chain amino acid transport system substrate-binding protein